MMLYFAHFSFVEEGNEIRNGYFTAIAEATGAEEAVEKFKSLLKRTHKQSDLFDHGTVKIFLDDCIELHSVPSQGLIGYYSSAFGEQPPHIFTSLIGAPEGAAESFGLEPDDGKEHTIEPLCVFRNRKRARKTKRSY
jgi:hypothetical protein